ncbi:stomatal closure-related actin-binding protein 3-like [Impatiens glandulifera]|uniref:stomatal closure-related actin-binding protein 3-like n=1 Tax=Impatiens glandulifera TaxID=253017 RepID=UPI001FB07A18|nr:stomatal closure-related actin-binding protein 3-like [Impatiens glandulifera]
MTNKVSPSFEDPMPATAIVSSVSADASFVSDQFPNYKIGPDNQILDVEKVDHYGPSLKEVVEKETSQLVEQHKRLSVRDLATKFDKNLASAAKLSDEARIRVSASLDGHVLLKKLRDALEFLKGRLAGRNKEDVEIAISMVETLAVKLTQKEGELIQEKFEVKKLANFLKQTSEDAKKLVSQERSFACAEIESARAVVQRIGEALDEEERNSKTSGKQEVEGLLEEVQQARRIRLLHQPSKVLDMEHELRELRLQIQEKSTISIKLQNQLEFRKRAEENQFCIYELNGLESVGSLLRIEPCSDEAEEPSRCSIQWYRLPTEGSRREIISGATKTVYAPEPFDVGRFLEVDIISNGQKFYVTTVGAISPAPELDNHVEILLRKSNTEFNVGISQMNGRNYSSKSVHLFQVGKTRMKLSRGWITKARESYSPSMMQLLCGYRGGGNSAAKSIFWQPRKGQSFILVFESERDRNAAIILARRYALDSSNVMLVGPEDQAFI